MWYIWSNDPNRMSVTLYRDFESVTYTVEMYRRLYPDYSWEIRNY